jgi:hypothetical protein
MRAFVQLDRQCEVIVVGFLGVMAAMAARNAAAMQLDPLSSPLPTAPEDSASAPLLFQMEPTKIPLPPNGKVGPVTAMDSILKLAITDYFQLRRGRLLVPSDRSNLTGPFLMGPPGGADVYSAAGAGGFIGPNRSATDRDDGLVAFGNCIAKRAKYFLGLFGLDNTQEDPLLSGGVTVALLGREPGSWDRSRSYDDRDMVTMGVGFQYRKKESRASDLQDSNNYANANILIGDLLAEKTLSRTGTLSLEATYYHWDAGESASQTTYVLASFRTPNYGSIGRVQTLIRWHQTSTLSGESKRTMLDAFITYIVHGHNLRVTAGYQRTDVGNTVIGNAVQAGLQMRK